MRTYFVDNLPEPIRTEVINSFKERNKNECWCSIRMEIELEHLLDSKVVDIEMAIDEELYNRMLKIAGWKK